MQPRTAQRIYLEDQRDRKILRGMNGSPSERKSWGDAVWKRDRVRQKEMRAIIQHGDLKTGKDFYAAAMVFQHGTLTDVKRAVRLAKASIELGYRPAKWLFAAATDRSLMFQNKVQKYGTQYRRNAKDKWQLYRYSRKTTDDERAQFDVPSLEQALEDAKNIGY